MTAVRRQFAPAERRVLLAHRSGADRAMIEGCLAGLGLTVVAGTPGKELPRLGEAVALLVCDEWTARRSREELLRLRLWPDGTVSPVLALVGSEAAALRMIDEGFDDALVTPVRRAILESRIRALLRLHETTLELARRASEYRRLADAMAGREVRMAELKKVIKALRAQLEEAGLAPVADDPLLGE